MIHNFASGYKYSEAPVYRGMAKFLTQFGMNHLWSVSLEFNKRKTNGQLGAEDKKKVLSLPLGAGLGSVWSHLCCI